VGRLPTTSGWRSRESSNVRTVIELFRSLTLRQILGLQLAWTSSLGLVFYFVVWLGERDFHPESSVNVTYSMSLRWQLGWGQILTLALVVAAPFLVWLAIRDRSQRR